MYSVSLYLLRLSDKCNRTYRSETCFPGRGTGTTRYVVHAAPVLGSLHSLDRAGRTCMNFAPAAFDMNTLTGSGSDDKQDWPEEEEQREDESVAQILAGVAGSLSHAKGRWQDQTVRAPFLSFTKRRISTTPRSCNRRRVRLFGRDIPPILRSPASMIHSPIRRCMRQISAPSCRLRYSQSRAVAWLSRLSIRSRGQK